MDAILTCSGPVLRHLDDDVPDVAIVDLILEDGPCLSVIAKLLELKVPIVIVSGHEDGEDFAALDGVAFVAKPFRSEVLLAKLREMVSSRVAVQADVHEHR